MKQLFLIFALVFFAALLPLNAIATSFGTNITIYDKNSNSETGWNGKLEDNEVEPGMVANQSWDLEGFFLEGSMLTMVGGFNFKDGNGGYQSGDIFIDIVGTGTDLSAVYGDIHGPQTKDENNVVQKTFGYDYVLDLDFSTGMYDVYAIDATTWVETAYYIQNQGSSPWRYVRDGKAVDDAKNIPFKEFYGVSDQTVNSYLSGNKNLLGGIHYAITVSLGFLPNGTDFISHFTMGCGNDNLMGRDTIPNPEPATLFLMGCGLIGLAGLGRKKLSR